MVRSILHRTLGLCSIVFIPSGYGIAQSCLDPLPDVPLEPEAQAYADDFGAALRRFRGMTIEDFNAAYGPSGTFRGPVAYFMRGDGSGDGRVNIADAVAILDFLFLGGAMKECQDASDANDDGRVNIADGMTILGYLFLGTLPPPPPFPAPGVDPTPDDLDCADATAITTVDYDPLQSDFFEAITQAYPLTEPQVETFTRNGFVILDDQKFESFPSALWSVYHNELPIYISTDALMQAVHRSYDEILKNLEEQYLIGQLEALLEKMDQGVKGLEKYSGGRDISDDLDNVAFWICTARSLLRGSPVLCSRPVEGLVKDFLGYVASEDCIPVDFFGVPPGPDACEDFSQFRPRSHYTQSLELENYFRAMMWVQRIGMRFAACPSHAAVAFLLAHDLVDSGAIAEWQNMNSLIEIFVGASDSLNAPGFLDFLKRTEVESVADLYDTAKFLEYSKAAIAWGAGRQRINSQVLQSNPDYVNGFTPIPPAYHLMGQRFIVDSFFFTNVVHDRVKGRPLPSALDAWFVLGNPATVPLLQSELKTWNYQANLGALRWILDGYEPRFWNENFYNMWLSALRGLSADTTQAPFPSVMQTEAWSRKSLNTQLASWAQLRHDTLLYAKPSYTGGSCDYPEGWVEPYPEFYKTLSDFGALAAERLEAMPMESAGVQDFGHILAYFYDLRDHSRMLASIAQAELDDIELTDEQRSFVRKALFGSLYGGPFGWYMDLHYAGKGDYFLFQPTIADVHSCISPFICPDGKDILHVGTGYANLMLVSVKTACAVKSYIGPVLSYHEFIEPNLHRWNDQEWLERLQADDGSPRLDGPPRPEWTGEFVR